MMWGKSQTRTKIELLTSAKTYPKQGSWPLPWLFLLRYNPSSPRILSTLDQSGQTITQRTKNRKTSACLLPGLAWCNQLQQEDIISWKSNQSDGMKIVQARQKHGCWPVHQLVLQRSKPSSPLQCIWLFDPKVPPQNYSNSRGLLIFTSSPILILESSRIISNVFSSSHLHLQSAHLHIFTSAFLILTLSHFHVPSSS